VKAKVPKSYENRKEGLLRMPSISPNSPEELATKPWSLKSIKEVRGHEQVMEGGSSTE
jgi:hypothetical protein